MKGEAPRRGIKAMPGSSNEYGYQLHYEDVNLKSVSESNNMNACAFYRKLFMGFISTARLRGSD
jgi:hypothetical protein